MNDRIRELIAVGASITANCQPCLNFHVEKAITFGASREDIAAAIEVGNRVKTTLGFGSGYGSFPALVTLFAFTNEYIEPAAVRPIMTWLDLYRDASEELVKQGRIFPAHIT